MVWQPSFSAYSRETLRWRVDAILQLVWQRNSARRKTGLTCSNSVSESVQFPAIRRSYGGANTSSTFTTMGTLPFCAPNTRRRLDVRHPKCGQKFGTRSAPELSCDASGRGHLRRRAVVCHVPQGISGGNVRHFFQSVEQARTWIEVFAKASDLQFR
jgi:hypothetical protein